ncbi:hypothetical protein EV360DRAFT_46111 [Lentinula raphanica]|nr:hypothetical protein EV360DRAFT_46111 [Lentinula raphanica]
MPLPESVLALDSLLNSLRNHKMDLLLQLEQIDSNIAAAERKRAKLCNDATFISKLPPELLSHIFLLCQKDHPAFQLVATQVCTRWRDMSIGTPMLWADIRVHIEHPSHLQLGLDKMETYLSRSGPSTLFAVRLTADANMDFSPFLKLIANHISRCSHLSVRAWRNVKASWLLREHLECLRAPHLLYLALHIDWADVGSYNRIMCDTPSIFKAGTPSLTSLQLTGYASALRPPISDGITTLHLDGVYMLKLSVLEYRQILGANRCLLNLSLRGLKIDSDSPTSIESQALELPMLRSLRIHATEITRASLNALLNALPLYRLESLVLCDVDNFCSSEFPNVKDLSLHRCALPAEQIGHLLVAFPSVTRLTLESESLLYVALSIGGSETTRLPILWPKLRIFCVRDLTVRNNVSALLKLVQERTRMNHPLDFLYLDSASRRRSANILRALEVLTNIGRANDDPDPWPPGADMDSAEDDSFWDID